MYICTCLSTNTEEVLGHEAVALFPVSELDLPDLQVIPQVQHVVDTLLYRSIHRYNVLCTYRGATREFLWEGEVTEILAEILS